MPSAESLNAGLRQVLLTNARASIAHGLEHGLPLPVQASEYDPALRAVRATFVTITVEERLRGCIGSLEARLPLVEDVVLHAFDAAFRDPRFPPLNAAELPGVAVHVSILSPHEPIAFEDEPDLLRQLRPGVDGLVVARGERRATFLPSVWESLREPARFLAHLKAKAGIPREQETPPLRAWRYTTESFSDRG